MTPEIIVGAQAAGSIMSFKGMRNAARSAEQVAEYNAQVAENEAVLLSRAKRDEERNLRKSSARLVGSQVTATAVGGVELSGSPLMALADTYYSTESEAARIRYAGEIEQIQKTSEADLTRVQGQARSAAIKTEAYATLLGDATSAYSTYKAIG